MSAHYTVFPGETIQIPYTDSEWELYTGEEGSATAAREIYESCVQAFKKFDELLPGHQVSKAVNTADKIIMKAMNAHAEVGASDTEPRQKRRSVWTSFLAVRLDVERSVAADIVDATIW